MWYIEFRNGDPGALEFLDPRFAALPPDGPVAQLGARFHGMEEVDGSNPSRSTKVFKDLGALAAFIAVTGVRLESKFGRHATALGFVVGVPASAHSGPGPESVVRRSVRMV
jgi:hypothetical protein